jgi:hypothetical protein
MVPPMVGVGLTSTSTVPEEPAGVVFDEEDDGAAEEDTDVLPRLSPRFAFRFTDLPKSLHPLEHAARVRAEERLEEKLLVAPPEPVGPHPRRHILPVARSRRRARRRRRTTTARARDEDEPAPQRRAHGRLSRLAAEVPSPPILPEARGCAAHKAGGQTIREAHGVGEPQALSQVSAARLYRQGELGLRRLLRGVGRG